MTDYRAYYPGFVSGYDDFQSPAVTSLTTAVITNVSGFTRAAGVTDPGYFTYGLGIFTMVRPGLYSINTSATFSTNLTGRRMVMLYVNGAEARRVDVSAGGQCTPQVTHTTRLATGDTLELRVFQSSGGALALAAAPGHDFQMTCVGV